MTSMTIHGILGAALVLIALTAAAIMAALWGPAPEAGSRGARTRRWLRRLHRVLGYLFITIYLIMVVRMLPRLWLYGNELPARSVLHAGFGFAIAFLLVAKIWIIRFLPHFRKYLPVFGVGLAFSAFMLVVPALPTAIREIWLSRAAGVPAGAAVGVEPAGSPMPAVASSATTPLTPPRPAGASPQDATPAATGAPASASAGIAPVAAILNARCIICHSGADAPRGLRLDSLQGILAGSATGPVVVAGDPGGSEIVRRIRGASRPRMPLDGPPYLDEGDIATLERWIASGLPGDLRRIAAAPAPPAGPAARPAGSPEIPSPSAVVAPRRPGESVSFAHVRPILMRRCVKCHTGDGLRGDPPEGLDLSTYERVLRGGERAVVVPGNPIGSMLFRHVRGLESPRMPFDGPPYLDAEQIELLRLWILQGARDVAGRPSSPPVGARVKLQGILTGRWQLVGMPFEVARGARIRDPVVGSPAEVRGTVRVDGSILATRVRSR